MPANRLSRLALILLGLPACSTSAVYQLPVPAAFADDPPPEIRVTLNDGRQVELRAPVLRGDSLFGLEFLDGTDGQQARQRHVALAVSEVGTLESRRPGHLAAALIAGPLVFGFVYLVGSDLLGDAMGN